MRIVAASDLHGDLGAADRLAAAGRDADLVIGAGDLCDQHAGLGEVLSRLAPVANRLVLVSGNHESVEELRDAADQSRVLHGQMAKIGGRVVAGLGGGIPPLPEKPWGSWDLTEDEADRLAGEITAADILILHSPPAGLGDDHSDEGPIGSGALLRAMNRLRPQLCVFGHVHDCWGAEGTRGPTHWRNLGPDPVTFDI